MANTWRATAQGVTFANAKDMLDAFNAHATRVMRIYRMYQFNNGTSAVTGVLTTMQIRRIITSVASGTSVTPVAHDTTNSALSSMSAGHNRTVTLDATFRQYLWSNDEPSVSGGTMDEWELLVPFAEVWNAGYADSNVQPLTCRQNEGGMIYHAGSSIVGTNDFEIEFTDAAS